MQLTAFRSWGRLTAIFQALENLRLLWAKINSGQHARSDRYYCKLDGVSLARAYHVWCEAWMRRDDLPEGYDGWQALDPTSQDRQSGRFRVGPASVRAIRMNQTGKKWPYDAEFVMSRITADILYYRVTNNFSTVSNQAISLARVNKGEVGTSLVTASYLKSDTHKPLDRTTDYRDSRASPEGPAQRYPCPPTHDCVFVLKLSGGETLGADLQITVTVNNRGAMLRRVDGRVVGTAVYYTGQQVRAFMSMDFTGLVSPGQSKSSPFNLLSLTYYNNNRCYCQFAH